MDYDSDLDELLQREANQCYMILDNNVYTPCLFFNVLLSAHLSYQLILGQTLISYVQIDPITVAIVLSAFLSLSPFEVWSLELHSGTYPES
jgi:hypothetical protein